MDQTIPTVYSRAPEPQQLGWKGRALAILLSLGSLAVLGVALSLKPSPRGIGTHLRLGLQPCQFERQTGVPCPTCGMTTSFAYFARGRILASLYVQPMGTLLAFMAAMVFWVGTYEALTGRAFHRLLQILPAGYYLWTLFGLALVAWAWKIFIHLTHRDGWGV
jgi:hypothetical protein